MSNVGPLRFRGTVLPTGETGELHVADGLVTSQSDSAATDIPGSFALPGLVDAHCHIGLAAGGAVDQATAETQAATDLASGVLLIRDAGSPIDTHWIDDLPGLPRVVRAGRHIARPKRYLRNFAVEISPDDLVDEVTRQARRGDGWVKLVGDWIDRDLGDLAPLWPVDVARQAIAAAHREGARVTAHCFAEQSVAELVDAGIDCIEHGTGLDDATTKRMAENGVALVPTLINIATFPTIADRGAPKFPAYAAHMRDLFRRRYDTIRRAVEAGVQVYAGTDAGGTIAHGRIADEVTELSTVAGPEFALGAASWRAREWLGAPGLDIGESADFVTYDADPRTNPEVLRHPAAIVLRGQRVA